MDRLLNETQVDKIVQLSNATDVGPKRHLSFESQIVLTLVYMIGVVGNVSALIILFHKDKVGLKINIFLNFYNIKKS